MTIRSPAGGLKASPTFRGLEMRMSVHFLNDLKAAASESLVYAAPFRARYGAL